MLRKALDKSAKGLIFLAAAGAIFLMGFMLLYIAKESMSAFLQQGIQMLLPSSKWSPAGSNAQYGLLPVITGTLYVSFIAVVLALIFGLGCAGFLNYYVSRRTGAVFLAFMDLAAGIPSVIFGFIGLTVLVKGFSEYLDMAAGQCVLAAGLILAVMLLPFVISTCYESIWNARKKYEPSGLALGFSREVVFFRILFPAVRPGIMASAMMAFGRALGETMAVMMVIGNSPIYPKLFGRGQTISALTALEMGSVEYGSLHHSALYAANAVLLIILGLVFCTG